MKKVSYWKRKLFAFLLLITLFLALFQSDFQSVSAEENSFATAVNVGSEIRNNFSNYVGMKITVGSLPITVTHLGRYYVAGNNGVHTLKIVKASDGTDVASVSVNMGSGTADSLGYKYASLDNPVVLSSNTAYYIVSFETNGGDQWYGITETGLPQLTTTSVATINSGIYYSGSAWIPVGGTGRCYVPVNFKYYSSTPAPQDTIIAQPETKSILTEGFGWNSIMSMNHSWPETFGIEDFQRPDYGDHTYTESDWDNYFDLLAWTGTDFVRHGFRIDEFEPVNDNSNPNSINWSGFTPNSEYMQRHYRILDELK
ncbi:MAG TPA: DUF4082 domain-containing protein [Clostridiaceae bacterium]|nr:DUF4082 domain-containing protein [Clostridiaceae bacterium]